MSNIFFTVALKGMSRTIILTYGVIFWHLDGFGLAYIKLILIVLMTFHTTFNDI